MCFDIIYQNAKYESNRYSLSKVIERTPSFDNGLTDARTNARTNARTGVTLNAPPPFFEWRGHTNEFVENVWPANSALISSIYICLFTFPHIASKQLNSFTTIVTLN